MTGILALETSTDACSVALAIGDGAPIERLEIAPRRHNRIIFEMLRELLPAGDLRAQGVECLAYGAGPGSFTGLRIAASAAQGLAFSSALPTIGVSTLALLAQGALEDGAVSGADTVLALIDARIGEVYCGIYHFDNGLAVELTPPWITLPGELELPGSAHYVGVGDGLGFLDDFPAHSAQRIHAGAADVVPRARSMVAIARERYRRGEFGSAADVQPLYVRDEITWKKLSEQGKQQ